MAASVVEQQVSIYYAAYVLENLTTSPEQAEYTPIPLDRLIQAQNELQGHHDTDVAEALLRLRTPVKLTKASVIAASSVVDTMIEDVTGRKYTPPSDFQDLVEDGTESMSSETSGISEPPEDIFSPPQLGTDPPKTLSTLLPPIVYADKARPGNPHQIHLDEPERLLAEWLVKYTIDGVEPAQPPCAQDSSAKTYLKSSSINKVEAHYEDEDENIMEVACAPLQKWGKKKFVIILWGADGIPKIIGTKGKKGHKQKVPSFFVWEGLKADGENGWSAEPKYKKVSRVYSVFATMTIAKSCQVFAERFPNLARAEARRKEAASVKKEEDSNLASSSGSARGPTPEDEREYATPSRRRSALARKNVNTPRNITILKVKNERSDDDSFSGAGSPSGPGLDRESMPEEIRRHLDDWLEKYGQTVPKFAAKGGHREHLLTNKSGKICTFLLNQEISLDVCHYSTGVQGSFFIAAQEIGTDNKEAFIIKYLGETYNSSMGGKAHKKAYFIWNGLDDEFEDTNSVWKIFGGKSAPHRMSTRVSDITPKYELDDDGEYGSSSGKRRQSMADIGGRAAKRRSQGKSVYAEVSSDVDAADDETISDVSDSLNPRSSFQSNAPTLLNGKAGVSVPAHTKYSLTEEMRTGLTFRFLPIKATSPRIKPFTACQDVIMLFKQASCGSVWDADTKPEHRSMMAVVPLAGDEKDSVGMYHGDKDDFEKLIQTVAESDWWGDNDEMEVLCYADQ